MLSNKNEAAHTHTTSSSTTNTVAATNGSAGSCRKNGVRRGRGRGRIPFLIGGVLVLNGWSLLMGDEGYFYLSNFHPTTTSSGGTRGHRNVTPAPPNTSTPNDGGNPTTSTTPRIVVHPTASPSTSTTTTTTFMQNTTYATLKWSSTQLAGWINKNQTMTDPPNKMSSTRREIMDFAPKPRGKDVEIYNLDAWHRLRELLGIEVGATSHGGAVTPATTTITNSSSSRSGNGVVVFCSNGGSATAGGGKIHRMDRWDEQFAAMIKETTNNPPGDDESTSSRAAENPQHVLTGDRSLKVINHAHGSRGSVHSAFLMHTMIPADADVIIWEFAINDGHPKGCGEINNGIIVWLDQVARHSSPPPLVILAYLWDVGFPLREKKNTFSHIRDTVFQCHGRIAAAYDFVVGSVHLGSYLSNLHWNHDALRKSFLADGHHPNKRGHLFLAFLLWDLVMDDRRLPITPNKNVVEGISISLPKPRWTCNRDPPAKNRVVFLLDEKYSFASWTAESPRNEDHNDGMIYPQLLASSNASASAPPPNMTSILHGKASEARQDRKFSLVLPCCNTGERFSFDLSSSTKNSSERGGTDRDGKRISALQVYAHDISTVAMLSATIMVDFLDAKGETTLKNASTNSANNSTNNLTQPEWVTFGEKECRVGHWFLNTWLVLPEEILVARIDFCRRQCSSNKISLSHVAIF